MAELEPKRGITDVPLPLESSEGEGLAPLEELPDTPAGWAERLRTLDLKNHRTAIVVIGAAALAAGVGVYVAKRRGEPDFFVRFADRRARQQGVISLGESKKYGAAVALPASEEALQHQLLFAMTGERGEVVRPSRGLKQTDKYNAVAIRAAGWLREHFAAQVSQADETK